MCQRRICSTALLQAASALIGALEHAIGLGRSPASGRIAAKVPALALPAAQDRVDRAPGPFHFIEAQEQRAIALNDVEQQRLVRLDRGPVAGAIERIEPDRARDQAGARLL